MFATSSPHLVSFLFNACNTSVPTELSTSKTVSATKYLSPTLASLTKYLSLSLLLTN